MRILHSISDVLQHNNNNRNDNNCKIYPFDNKSTIKQNIEYKENYEKSSKSVGRILVRCIKVKDGKVKWSCGSGFLLSTDRVVTARHVLDMSNKYRPGGVYIYFGCNASTKDEIDLSSIDQDEFVHKLEVVGIRDEIDKIFPDSLMVTGHDGNRYKWSYHNDIEILKFKDNILPPDQKYILPMIPTGDLNKLHFIVGYPGHINCEDYNKFISSNETGNRNSLRHSQLSVQTRNFQRKTVLIGSILKLDKDTSIHDCHTMGGVSGGMFAECDQESKFIGMHLGGSKETGNVILMTTHPLFHYIYTNYILTDELLQENSESITQYLNYFKKEVTYDYLDFTLISS